ncbi:MAG: tagatose-bisphosphate aldolase [Candidatus Niyogibacteria bacterium CG10_big_fil_rev_8_21_14_0_10_42_19]|uniref:Tagatose-bisphosphate aldolase n=1 Tax=Candidatus Niyogibacteria bacterium CG10_big_fil_rev_8_21_14_0_10_42_19 TaxID=1974725 RepID=A0A2H0TEY2_9BACT|nr:MAG: tagatose-bisphosphate aldolase [Candidatus Niyogibacteria bacterium CG10_big_fil_rev_8_21_14_0_10_42_19]
MTLNDWFKKALREGWAVPHLNISSLEQLKAMVNVALRLSSPLHIGTSSGEAKYLGMRQCVALIRSFREDTGLPIFLNSDHFGNVEEAKRAVDAGYDSIHIDLSREPFELNIKGTKEVVEYAKSKNKEISVEGELGYLRGSSKVQKEVIQINPEDMTDPEQAVKFVKETKIDRLAPVVGNLHGIAANEPNLDIARVANIRVSLPDFVSLVLHGGSGIPDEQIREAVKAGINNIHVNTEIRVVYADALRKFVTENPEETTPYKILPPVIEAMEKKIEEKIKLFGSVNRI